MKSIFLSFILLLTLNSIAAEQTNNLKKDLETLTSKELEGRKAMTEGEIKTQQYLIEEIKKLKNITNFTKVSTNFKNSFSFYNPDLKIDETSISTEQSGPLEFFKDYIPLGISSSADRISLDNAVIVSCDDTRQNKIRNYMGKLVILFESECNLQLKFNKLSLYKIIKSISIQNPSAIIVVSKHANLLTNQTSWPSIIKNRTTPSRDPLMISASKRADNIDDNSVCHVPLIYMRERALETLIKKELTTLKRDQIFPLENPIHINISITPKYLTGSNIIAHLPGESDNNIVVSAHYDGYGINVDGKIYPGADDNASGVAAVLELMRYFNSFKERSDLKTGIIFIFYSAEEGGLIGSKSLAKQFDNLNIIPNILANINLDGIAGGDNNTYYLLGQLANPTLTDYFKKFNNQLHNLNFSDKIEFAFQKGSDHYSLHLYGVPIIDFTS